MLDGIEIAFFFFFFLVHVFLEIWSPYLASFHKVLVVGHDYSTTAELLFLKSATFMFSTFLCLYRRMALLKS